MDFFHLLVCLAAESKSEFGYRLGLFWYIQPLAQNKHT